MRSRRWFPSVDVLWEHRFADRRHDTTFRDTTNVTGHPARIFTVTNKGGNPTDPPLTHGDIPSHG
jgi:hypothetical protein